jgi:hypothetical protein
VSPAAHHLSDMHLNDQDLPTLPGVPENSIHESVPHTADPKAKFEVKGNN